MTGFSIRIPGRHELRLAGSRLTLSTAAGWLLFAVSLMACNFSVRADTVYIRDTLYVPLRGGQSSEYRILHRGLKSGTRLERLEENEESGYSRVRLADGMEGWIQTQYLVDEPIAQSRLDAVQQQLEELEARYQQTLLKLRSASEASQAQTAELAALKTERDKLAVELERITGIAADTLNINEENQRLADEQNSLFEQIEQLDRQNEMLADDRAQEWFLRGAGTIMIGLLFGFWVARRIYQKRGAGGWA
ncbi:MAG: TIGR04211 family SH3 domain-containing protein [Proteobacteria bacterium]|nr:TIGR04211 family SH3 domain-containing protein [Pseudomonadota bacterium]